MENGLETGRKILEDLAEYIFQLKREEIPASELVTGMKCGSDGLSGITANPTVGRFSDLLVAQGGSAVLTGVPEMFGAEGFLMNRCINEEVFHKAVNRINGFENCFLRHNEVSTRIPAPAMTWCLPGALHHRTGYPLRRACAYPENRYQSPSCDEEAWGNDFNAGVVLWFFRPVFRHIQVIYLYTMEDYNELF